MIRHRLDQLLGLVPMYKLVVMGLTMIALMALLLMSVGYLHYEPLLFVGSIALLVGVSVAGNMLFGWLFGVRPQLESAIITGLILALLFSPSESLLDATKLALVALIAMASKYIIAVRGKHIFNPAAIAIVIASVSGFAYASWWVASPGLLLVTVIVALLILYKTQKIAVGAVYVAVAVAALVVQSLLRGELSVEVVQMLVTSWPLVFVAGVMLSEPLTLPPRRKQQLIYAATVGLLTALPFHYASITMTPALALVLGNIYSFYVGYRRSIRLRFVSKKPVGKDGYEFLFDITPFAFEPGQYIELSLPHSKADFRGTRRVFTIIGHPNGKQVSIATRFPKNHSSFKGALMTLKPGATIHGVRVAGDFVLPPQTDTRAVVCIAGGIGVTPFVSFAMNTERPLQLIYAAEPTSKLAFGDTLARYNVGVTVVSNENVTLPDSEWKQVRGRLDKELLSELIVTEEQPIVYISGPPAMVTSVVSTVKKLGVRDVRTDAFSGY